MEKCHKQEFLESLPTGKTWKRIGTGKRSGTVVPLFSVYSDKSQGVGDFSDLNFVIDWCSKTGNSILQLLPMNEVGALFCPYDSVSSFALEPMYLSLSEISKKHEARAGKLRKQFDPGKGRVDYRVKDAKLKLLRDIFDETFQGMSGVEKEALEKFRRQNAYWLRDFTLFKVLKEHHEGKGWFDWEERFRNRDVTALADFEKKRANDIAFQSWLQWHLFKQFSACKAYSASRNVLMKGDLPILVSRDSADVWAHPGLFKLDFDAGAPPDMYCAKGQRWGTPLYNWQAIFADNGGRYFIEKLAYAENFYDLLRIDHVVGLFRIWAIPQKEPAENKGLNGFFDPAQEPAWEEQGRKVLTFILSHTRMLLCAEDLGTIPPSCTKTLKELGIAGNDVQRWTKDWNVRHDFLRPQEYRVLSVTMLSTHDTTNWPAWWENEAGTIDEDLFNRRCAERGIDSGRAGKQLFAPERSRHGRLRWRESISSSDMLVSILGKARQEVLDFIEMYENSYREKEKLWKLLGMEGVMREKSDNTLVKAVTKQCMDSTALYFINLIFDFLFLKDDYIKGDPYQARVNTPGTVGEHNWNLTLPVSLEELLKSPVNAQIRKLIEASGRLCAIGEPSEARK